MNSNKKNSVYKKNISNTLIIVFISFDIIFFNMILGLFNKATHSGPLLLFVGFLTVSILASPIQAGFSDYLGRKKSLIISISVTLICLFILLFINSSSLPLFTILATIALLKGLFGNTIPIAWGAIGDIDRKNERFFFAISEAAYAIGFLLILLFNLVLSSNSLIFILILAFVVQIYFCVKYFIDPKDFDKNKYEGEEDKNLDNKKNREKEEHFIKHLAREPKLIFQDLKKRTLRLICLSFIFLEISLYIILILYTDFPGLNSLVPILMMAGYLLGSGMMKFCKKISNKDMIRFGFILSVFPLLIYVILYLIFKDNTYILISSYFIHSIGNAILSPTILAEIGTGLKPHQKGKRYGLLDSSDAIALLAASLLIIEYQKYHITIIYMVIFSLLMITSGWIIYHKYDSLMYKNRKNRQ
ncbi:MAG: hypothetical protein S4CHLAM7_07830 [Chlamydiae bacterium]|nr:hypothetical protein [Chlamydiota bacterium]